MTDRAVRGHSKSTSSLSHEFYQVMVGSTSMSLHGWKQLALWSIDYSCLTNLEKHEARKIFQTEWEIFCRWIVDEYGGYAKGLDIKPQ